MQPTPKSFLSRRLWVLAGLAGALPFVSCGTGTTTVDVASETSALVTAQCDAQSSRAAVGCEASAASMRAARSASRTVSGYTTRRVHVAGAFAATLARAR